jgi:hypothetical protein
MEKRISMKRYLMVFIITAAYWPGLACSHKASESADSPEGIVQDPSALPLPPAAEVEPIAVAKVGPKADAGCGAKKLEIRDEEEMAEINSDTKDTKASAEADTECVINPEYQQDR